MDGNQRWALINKKDKLEGYLAGLNNLKLIIDKCIEKKIKNLTVYALSSENIKRASSRIIFNLIRDNHKEFKWDAVRFANKVICVIHGVRNSIDYDYVVWIDADTFTFRPMPLSFLQNLLPTDSMLTYLGREREETKNSKYPECGFVGYNLRHPEIQNFVNDWEQLYITDDVFKLLEWHDSFIFWHLNKKYKKEKNIKVTTLVKELKDTMSL